MYNGVGDRLERLDLEYEYSENYGKWFLVLIIILSLVYLIRKTP